MTEKIDIPANELVPWSRLIEAIGGQLIDLSSRRHVRIDPLHPSAP